MIAYFFLRRACSTARMAATSFALILNPSAGITFGSSAFTACKRALHEGEALKTREGHPVEQRLQCGSVARPSGTLV